MTACGPVETVEMRIARADPAAPVQAKAETVPVGTANADAADDPAIWRNPADPARSLIVGTDKKAGLYVYGLDGAVRSFTDAGRVNNVTLVTLDGTPLVIASDRNDLTRAKLALFRLDTQTGRLSAAGSIEAGAGEAYGVCAWMPPIVAAGGDLFYVYAVMKDGTIRQFGVNASLNGRLVRTMTLATQAEGCVVDHGASRLYVGEEDAGIWRFGALPDAPVAGELVARADGKSLVADVEGLAVARNAATGGYLIASSQGDNAYTVYSLNDLRVMGRFRIAAGALGATEETDGIELALGDFGADYPDGLFVAQDGINPPRAQNFKLVSWAEVKRALSLP